MTSDSKFTEIPGSMQAVADKNIQQVRLAFDGFMSAARKNAAIIEWRAASVHSGSKDIWQKAIGFAERNITVSLDLAQRLVHANSLPEVVELQSAFAQSQMRALAEQAIEFGQTVATIATAGREPKK